MIHAYAATEAKKLLTPFDYKPRTLAPYDVEIAITHCGICHTDVHLVDNDWGISSYPLVPGHEIIGTVLSKGEKVIGLENGQRVGVGAQCASCMSCVYCETGEEQLCAKHQPTCLGQFGGFANSIITDARFVFLIPEKLESSRTAPLLCGGATVYSPLRRFIHSPLMRVGIIGIGGLGHLAIQFAKAFECEITAFSSSASKEKEARELGAAHFFSSVDFSQTTQLASYFDLIIDTAPNALEWPHFLKMLKPKCFLCLVGVPAEKLEIPAFSLIGGNRGICGSNIGSVHEIKEMLKLAEQNNIGAVVETFPMSDVNLALQKVRENKVRYRAVLET
ncbi:MAG: NAD(P)-dependent alcohol dehydrogenase [Gammaproteobacteria bacterium]